MATYERYKYSDLTKVMQEPPEFGHEVCWDNVLAHDLGVEEATALILDIERNPCL